MSAPELTELETAINMIVNVFDRYSCAEGNNMTLTKREMKRLLKNELPSLLSKAKKKDAFDELFKDLDENSNSELEFEEFIVLLSVVLLRTHMRFENVPPKK